MSSTSRSARSSVIVLRENPIDRECCYARTEIHHLRLEVYLRPARSTAVRRLTPSRRLIGVCQRLVPAFRGSDSTSILGPPTLSIWAVGDVIIAMTWFGGSSSAPTGIGQVVLGFFFGRRMQKRGRFVVRRVAPRGICGLS